MWKQYQLCTEPKQVYEHEHKLGSLSTVFGFKCGTENFSLDLRCIIFWGGQHTFSAIRLDLNYRWLTCYSQVSDSEPCFSECWSLTADNDEMKLAQSVCILLQMYKHVTWVPVLVTILKKINFILGSFLLCFFKIVECFELSKGVWF